MSTHQPSTLHFSQSYRMAAQTEPSVLVTWAQVDWQQGNHGVSFRYGRTEQTQNGSIRSQNLFNDFFRRNKAKNETNRYFDRYFVR